MSGGVFDYNQYKIRQIWEDIQQELDKQGQEKSKEDLRYYDKEYLDKYPEERFEHVYREDVQQIFKDAIEILKKAEIYTQRIDWYLSGDDGEDNLVSRLKSDLDKLRIALVGGQSEQFYCHSDKDNRYERCEEQCYLCKIES